MTVSFHIPVFGYHWKTNSLKSILHCKRSWNAQRLQPGALWLVKTWRRMGNQLQLDVPRPSNDRHFGQLSLELSIFVDHWKTNTTDDVIRTRKQAPSHHIQSDSNRSAADLPARHGIPPSSHEEGENCCNFTPQPSDKCNGKTVISSTCRCYCCSCRLSGMHWFYWQTNCPEKRPLLHRFCWTTRVKVLAFTLLANIWTWGACYYNKRPSVWDLVAPNVVKAYCKQIITCLFMMHSIMPAVTLSRFASAIKK